MVTLSSQDPSLGLQEVDLDKRAQDLLMEFGVSFHREYGTGSMSCTMYDTAWVALVQRQLDGVWIWFSPASFHYVVEQQLDDGSWPCYASPIDRILNTAVSLLVLHRHAQNPRQTSEPSPEILSTRVQWAYEALSRLLHEWPVEKTIHVGSEILVPSVLEHLAKEGFRFSFDGRHALLRLYTAKIAKFLILNGCTITCSQLHSILFQH